MISAMQDLICRAIVEKRVLEFSYKLQRRRVEPHTLGYDNNDTLVLCGWLKTGLKPGFRDFHVAKLNGLTMTDESFDGPRPGYNPQDSTMSKIVCGI